MFIQGGLICAANLKLYEGFRWLRMPKTERTQTAVSPISYRNEIDKPM